MEFTHEQAFEYAQLRREKLWQELRDAMAGRFPGDEKFRKGAFRKIRALVEEITTVDDQAGDLAAYLNANGTPKVDAIGRDVSEVRQSTIVDAIGRSVSTN